MTKDRANIKFEILSTKHETNPNDQNSNDQNEIDCNAVSSFCLGH